MATNDSTGTHSIIPFSELPRKGLLADFSAIGIDQLVKFHTHDFYDIAHFDMQLENIKERAKELNAHFVVYHMSHIGVLSSPYTYLIKFVQDSTITPH